MATIIIGIYKGVVGVSVYFLMVFFVAVGIFTYLRFEFFVLFVPRAR